MKPNKSILKRIRVTKNGKMIHRPVGQNHFNAKHSTNVTRRKRGQRLLAKPVVKTFRKYI